VIVHCSTNIQIYPYVEHARRSHEGIAVKDHDSDDDQGGTRKRKAALVVSD
jgi:hypothetical protein